MCVEGGKNRSGAKKPNNGHPKKETGVVLFMFCLSQGGRVECFFFLCLVGNGGGRKGLKADFTENTASVVYGQRKNKSTHR